VTKRKTRKPNGRPKPKAAKVCSIAPQKHLSRTSAPSVQTKAIVGEVVVTDLLGRRRRLKDQIIRQARVEDGEWDDPADQNTRSKTAHQVRGHRVADPLVTLHKRQPSEVTTRHVRCAERYRDDFEAAQGARDPDAKGNNGGPQSGCGPSMAHLLALEAYRGANDAVGPRLCFALEHVVLGYQTVSAFAAAARLSPETAKGYLLAALDRLVDHYEPIVVGKSSRRREFA